LQIIKVKVKIRQMVRKGTLSLATRLQIKVLLEETTMTQRDIANKFNCSQSTIRNIKKRICNQQTLQSNYQGRARKTSPREDRAIIKTALEMRRKPVAQIHSNIVALGVNVSSRTVRRRLKEANITAHRPAIKHKLTPCMIKKRIAWGKKYKHYGVDLWSKVSVKQFLGSDSKRICLIKDYRFASRMKAACSLTTTAAHLFVVDRAKDIYQIVSAKELNIRRK